MAVIGPNSLIILVLLHSLFWLITVCLDYGCSAARIVDFSSMLMAIEHSDECHFSWS